MNDNKDLLQDLEKMPVDELLRYESAAAITNRIVSFFGVTFLLLILFFPSIWTILVGFIIVYILGLFAASLCDFLTLVREHLSKRNR